MMRGAHHFVLLSYVGEATAHALTMTFRSFLHTIHHLIYNINSLNSYLQVS
jgi:predicted transcriptional regulator